MPSKPKGSASGVFPTLAKTADFHWNCNVLGACVGRKRVMCARYRK